MIQRCLSNVLSFEHFINEVSKYRYTYPDVVEPLLSSFMEFLYGFKLKIDILKHSLALNNAGSEVQHHLECLVKLPTLDANQNDYLDHINSYLNGSIFQSLQQSFKENEEEFSKQYCLRLLRCGIQEIFNIFSLNNHADSVKIKAFLTIIKLFVRNWNKQQEEQERLKKESESLYKIK